MKFLQVEFLLLLVVSSQTQVYLLFGAKLRDLLLEAIASFDDIHIPDIAVGE